MFTLLGSNPLVDLLQPRCVIRSPARNTPTRVSGSRYSIAWTRFSRGSRTSSARSSRVIPSTLPSSTSDCAIQRRKPDSLTPRSLAISATGFVPKRASPPHDGATPQALQQAFLRTASGAIIAPTQVSGKPATGHDGTEVATVQPSDKYSTTTSPTWRTCVRIYRLRWLANTPPGRAV